MKKPRLWLTYAWKDNQDEQVDFLIFKLREAGLDVMFDRRQIIPGQRLWPQIEGYISDSIIDAWAIYVTENSLSSGPCIEELQYALQQALNNRGIGFPLIPIVSGSVDFALLPKALSTRLCVSLSEVDCFERVVSGVRRETPPEPKLGSREFGYKSHYENDTIVVEVRPRVGQWSPAYAGVLSTEPDCLSHIAPGSPGFISQVSQCWPIEIGMAGFFVKGIWDTISVGNTLQIQLTSVPTKLIFGGRHRDSEFHFELSEEEILAAF